VTRLLASLEPALHALLAPSFEHARTSVDAHLQMTRALLDRERAIQRDLATGSPRPLQPGLFDRRALNEAAAARTAFESLHDASRAQEARLKASLTVEEEASFELVVVRGRAAGHRDDSSEVPC
jgi:hypothetical protein